MKVNFLNVIKNLLPKSKTWDITKDTNIRKLLEAIAVLPEELRKEIELVYMDLFADSTRQLDEWEKVFTVLFTRQEYDMRRSTLALLWSTNHGGQSKYFLETTLKNIFPEIVVEENIPCKNPRQANIAYLCSSDNENMVCDKAEAVCDYREGDETLIPQVLRNNSTAAYSIPNDKRYWAFCFYVCKRVVRNDKNYIMFIEKLEIPVLYKNYIEYLILRLKPVHTVAVLAVEWVEENARE